MAYKTINVNKSLISLEQVQNNLKINQGNTKNKIDRLLEQEVKNSSQLRSLAHIKSELASLEKELHIFKSNCLQQIVC